MPAHRLLICCLAIVFAACSGSDGDSSAASAADATDGITTDDIAADDVTVDDATVDDAAAEATDGSGQEGSPERAEPIEEDAPRDTTPAPPAEAFDPDAALANDVEANPETAWISRRSMEATAIEVVWSAPEGAADYQIHRLDRSGDVAPQATEMTADNRLHSGELNGTFLDEDVNENSLYWYGVRGVDATGTVLSTGWHAAAAVTDEQPPSSVELTVEQVDGSVLVSWEEPEENFQMHGYRVFRGVGDGESELVSTTWNLNQTSFIDEEPPDEQTTYSVVAFDFHWNDSAPTDITVDLS